MKRWKYQSEIHSRRPGFNPEESACEWFSLWQTKGVQLTAVSWTLWLEEYALPDEGYPSSLPPAVKTLPIVSTGARWYSCAALTSSN
jgi:hypothetical protein